MNEKEYYDDYEENLFKQIRGYFALKSQGLCPLCNIPVDITTFKDELSLKEFKLSGLCQQCQDDTFKED